MHLYLVKGGGLVKIGISKNAWTRLSALQVASPIKLTLLGAWVCENARQLEAELHKRFADYNRHGEWFALSAGVLASLRDELDTNFKTHGVWATGTDGKSEQFTPEFMECANRIKPPYQHNVAHIRLYDYAVAFND